MTAISHVNVHIRRDGGEATAKSVQGSNGIFWTVDIDPHKHGAAVTIILDDTYTEGDAKFLAEFLSIFMMVPA